MQIIKDKAIVEDSWVHFSGEGNVPDGKIIVPLEIWKKHDFSGRPIGVLLDPSESVHDIRDDLDKIDLVAIHFPTFMDGRGYSIAKILRDRFGYQKEIRAVGDVLRDQIFYMHRCGINAFEVKEGKDIENAVKAFCDFSVTYQVSSDEQLPLYRRK